MKNNEMLKKLCDKKYHDMIQAGTATFLRRYSQQFTLPKSLLIDDSISAFGEYIQATSLLIRTMINKDSILPPCQIDLIIIPRKVINEADNAGQDDDDTKGHVFDDDDDSDSDEEDESENEDVDANDQILNIRQQLDDVDVIYEHHVPHDD